MYPSFPPPAMDPRGMPMGMPVMMPAAPLPDMRALSQAISRLTLPLQTVFLDPLIVQCQALAMASPQGADDCVRALQSLLLRAPNKLPVVYFIDALLRSQTSPVTPRLRELMALHLEDAFCSAFGDADEYSQGKMLNIVNIWEGNQMRPRTFPAELLARIRARVDANYNGPPLSALPPAPSPPPPASLAYHPIAPQHFAPQAVMSPYMASYSPPPPAPYAHSGMPPPAPLAYAPPPPVHPMLDPVTLRASDLLAQFVSRATPPGQSMTLAQVQAQDRALYGRLMTQAQLEVGAPSMQQPQPAWRHPPVSSSGDYTAVAHSLIVMNEAELRSAHLSRVAARMDKSVTRVRAWYSAMDEWTQGALRRPHKVVALFEDKSAAGHTAAAHDPRKFAVPKDEAQAACALSGEPFETFWSDDEQMWMYSNAIRPDPSGPIYNVLVRSGLGRDATDVLTPTRLGTNSARVNFHRQQPSAPRLAERWSTFFLKTNKQKND